MALTDAQPIKGRIEEQRAFYQAVGLAVINWQSVEYNITGLFMWLLQGDPGAASAAYHQAVGFKTQLGMVEAAADWALKGSDLLPALKKLLKRASEKSRKRNKIVHLSASIDIFDDGRRAMAIGPSFYDTRENKNQDHFYKEDIEKWAGEFKELAHEIYQFREHLPQRLPKRKVP